MNLITTASLEREKAKGNLIANNVGVVRPCKRLLLVTSYIVVKEELNGM